MYYLPLRAHRVAPYIKDMGRMVSDKNMFPIYTLAIRGFLIGDLRTYSGVGLFSLNDPLAHM
jgi:hypothetical protein